MNHDSDHATLAQQRQLALDAARMGWWHYDPVSRIATYDERYKEIFGVSGHERPNDEILKLLHPEDLPRVWAAVEAALDPIAPRAYSAEYRVNRPDGTMRWVEAHGLAVFEGEGSARRAVGFAGTVADVTDRRRAQEELRERDAALRQSEHRLRVLNRRKDDFLAMLSHELRNPLAPIRNSIYILRRALPGTEQGSRAQQVLERQTEHLTRIVDDLLDVTRILRGKFDLRRSRVDLREVVLGASDDFRVLMDGRGLAFDVSVPTAPVWANADPTRLTQLIGNLLHNAAKFTPRGGDVALSLRAADGVAELRVRDTGAGIASTLLPQLFEPFVQGERTLARTEGGLGLGLALAKGVAELHGGTVRAESKGEGAGTEFVVSLPLLADAIDVDARPEAERSGRARRVLVVDDNHDAADSLAEAVELLGHVAEVAYDGPSALHRARTNPPEIVLCDLGMPGMSGYDVAQSLRAIHGNTIRLVAVSGYAQPDDVKRSSEAGFDAHVAKPADMKRIERLLG